LGFVIFLTARAVMPRCYWQSISKEMATPDLSMFWACGTAAFGNQYQPVIVESGSKWHELFRLEARDDENPVDFERYDRATIVTLWNAYRAVVRQLR
jgi:hypothetical protein